MHCSNT